MGPSVTLLFSDAARRLGAVARAGGLVVPTFRSPPGVPGARRTLRRHPGGAVVSVVLRGRPFPEVAHDMVDGVVAANRLSGAPAARWRTALTAALAADPEAAGPTRGPGGPSGVPGAPAAGTLAGRGLARGARVAERQTQAA